MPALTRRRSLESPDECWHVYYGDVRVGTIAIRTGMPPGEDPGGLACGFYPGSHPSECTRRPISRHGVMSEIGRPRSIVASIAASACRRTGNRNGARVADRGWKRHGSWEARLGNERQMTFEEIDARAKELFGKLRPIEEWPFIDEGDRTYWRKRAVEESKAASSNRHGSSQSNDD